MILIMKLKRGNLVLFFISVILVLFISGCVPPTEPINPEKAVDTINQAPAELPETSEINLSEIPDEENISEPSEEIKNETIVPIIEEEITRPAGVDTSSWPMCTENQFVECDDFCN